VSTASKYEKLDTLYASLPTVDCKKLCGFENCGPIQASKIETQRVEERRGFVKIHSREVWQDVHQFAFRNLPYLPEQKDFYRALVFWQPDENNFNCQFFMPAVGTCSVYGLRPIICRLFALVDNLKLRCPFGCVPTRWISNEEAKKICEEVIKIQEEETPCL
jgi:Fe-S-cluster containining protein